MSARHAGATILVPSLCPEKAQCKVAAPGIVGCFGWGQAGCKTGRVRLEDSNEVVFTPSFGSPSRA